MFVESSGKVLIVTNHMANFGGSEMVALELAEAFLERGYKATIYANYIGAPIDLEVERAGVELLTGKPYPDPLAYDIVWSQHHVLPLLLSGHIRNGLRKPYIAYAHLSPFEHFEFPGPFLEERLADACYVNSEETRLKMLEFGIPYESMTVFHNAAPNAFFSIPKKTPAQLRDVFVVSNHIPPELHQLLRDGMEGITFTHVGDGALYQRVTPELLARADAVVTIGKTVQYAIAASRPVFCYDHFSGPGWLTMENYQRASEKNYSGRCTLQKLSAEELAVRLRAGFATAYDDISRIRELEYSRYRLETYIDGLIAQVQTEPRAVIDFATERFKEQLEAECAMATIISRQYAQERRLARACEEIHRELEVSRQSQQNYSAALMRIETLEHHLEAVLNSRSWKISAPIRKVLSLCMAKSS